MQNKKPQVVIVGGGAGGLELAAKLGRSLGKKQKATITLVDATATHVWKPLLHEVAAGTLDSNEDQLNYFAYAAHHHFHFSLGELIGLDRQQKQILLAPILKANQDIIMPERSISYDVLVIAIGSIANDFQTPGAIEHCLFLDNALQANQFQHQFLDAMMALSIDKNRVKKFSLAIVGGGATGVELAAELRYAVEQMKQNGLAIADDAVDLSVVEASDRILPALSERISKDVTEVLNKLNIDVITNKKVTKISVNGLYFADDSFLAADLIVWSAGIKAPEILVTLDGLKVNKLNQLLVKNTLQTTSDNCIFAFGDCACCQQENTNKSVPPRAQAAHQQANFLAKNIPRYLENKSLGHYHFRDYGSLISLGRSNAIGTLMSLLSTQATVEGFLANFAYRSLYKMHQTALFGFWRTMLLTIANVLSKSVKPRIKLH